MELKWIVELIGYAASALIAVSLLMKSIVRLRVLNLAGAVIFVVYGLLIRAYPIAIINAIIAAIDVYFLYTILAAKEYFTLLETRHDSEYLQQFLKFHDKEIKRFLPDFTYLPTEQALVFFILRDMVPAGLFIAQQQPGGNLWVSLDFVIPGYRDFKVGYFLYRQKSQYFKDKGIRRILSAAGTAAHTQYLRRMGFAPDPTEPAGLLYSRVIE
jgi:hypothetical protein